MTERMTAKRFTLFDDGETIIDNEKVADDGGKQIYWTVEYVQMVKLVKLLNELHEENKQLRHDATILIQSNQDYRKENEQLKHNNKMLSMKMSEVSVKYRLLKEFSDDTNPNEAVETVLHELMMITKKYR